MRRFNQGGSSNRIKSKEHRFDQKQGNFRQMHSATCSKCGRDCQVPFRPTEDKPVYCSDCFGKQDTARPNRSFRNNDRPSHRSEPSIQPQLGEINQKLDAILKLLTEPS